MAPNLPLALWKQICLEAVPMTKGETVFHATFPPSVVLRLLDAITVRDRVITDDCDMEQEVRHLLRPVLGEKAVDGDNFGVPTMADVSERLLAVVERLQDALANYGEHDRTCILSQWEAGEPTPDGGYRMKYRGTWYSVRPNNELPACECGLDAALTQEPT